MSSREFILDSVRKNQPASRPMPVVPTFDKPLDSVPGALLATFTTALERMGGVVVGLRAGDTLDAFIASRFPTARVFCSATPEFTGMREIGSIKRRRSKTWTWASCAAPSASPKPARCG